MKIVQWVLLVITLSALVGAGYLLGFVYVSLETSFTEKAILLVLMVVDLGLFIALLSLLPSGGKEISER